MTIGKTCLLFLLLFCGPGLYSQTTGTPFSLVAGAGYKSCIPLNWRWPSSNPPGPDDPPSYYNIYRKTEPAGLFTLIGNTQGYSDFIPSGCYTDTNVTPAVSYSYKVTAFVDSIETGFSNAVTSTCGTTGYQANIPNSSYPLVIDGVIDPSEWADAVIINITNSLGVFNQAPAQPVSAYLKRVRNFLYIGVRDLADTTNGQDQCAIYFDNNANKIFDNSDGNLWIDQLADNSVQVSYRGISGTFPSGLAFALPVPVSAGVTAAMSMNAGHREYEARIDFDNTPLHPADTVFGCYLFTRDQGTGNFNAHWPDGHVWCDPGTYGELHTTTPVYIAPVTKVPSIGTQYNVPVTLPVTVSNFNNISAFSLRLEYDPTVLTFTGFSNVNPQLPGLTVADVPVSASLHKISVAWSGTTFKSIPPDGKIADLFFFYSTGTSPLTWNNEANAGNDCFYLDAFGDPLTDTPSSAFYINGDVHYSPGFRINGTINYNNDSLTSLDNVKVILKQGSTRIDSTTTNPAGNFEFYPVMNNTYTLQAICSKPWQGVNGTDALKIQRHFAGIELITEPVRLLAADVNNSGSINGTDAVKVKMRFVGMDTSFARGDWTFAKPVTGGDTVIVNGSDVTQNIFGLCVGDVNGSNIPGPGKSNSDVVELLTDGVIELEENKTSEVPVRIKSATQIGAVSLVFNYPSAWMTIEDVTMNRSGLIYQVAGNQLRLAWSDPDPFDLKSGDLFLTLFIKQALQSGNHSEEQLSLASETEIADSRGNPLKNIELTCPALKMSANDNAFTGLMRIYPSPSQGRINLDYSLPETRIVIVEITKADGTKACERNLGSQSTGRHSANLDLSFLSSGFYFCRIIDAEKQLVLKNFYKFVITK